MSETAPLNKKEKHKSKSLDDLKKRRRNRSLKEIEKILTMFGFVSRKATKEGNVWKRGTFTLTLPVPHGSGDKSLHPKYIGTVIQLIEEAEFLELEKLESKNEDSER